MSKVFTTILGIALIALAQGNDDLPLWSQEFEPTALFELSQRNIDEQVYRLPTNVVPIEYDIYLDLYFAERTENPFSYDGEVHITINVSFV